MMESAEFGDVWLYFWVFLIAAGTYLIRLSFIYWFSDRTPNVQTQRVLSFIPAAALSAIIFPAIVNQGGELAISFDNHRLFALLVALVVAWLTKNTLAVLGVGMATLWVIDFLL